MLFAIDAECDTAREIANIAFAPYFDLSEVPSQLIKILSISS